MMTVTTQAGRRRANVPAPARGASLMRKRDLQSNAAAVKAAVRQVADEYLQDPNINSVGVGHKVKDGRKTDDLVLQFTVGQKVAPELVLR